MDDVYNMVYVFYMHAIVIIVYLKLVMWTLKHDSRHKNGK